MDDPADEALDIIPPRTEWKYVTRGGNTRFGVHGGHGACPCERNFTINTVQKFYDKRPTRKQLKDGLKNPPPHNPIGHKCAGDCVHVLTHLWHGWMLYHHPRKKRWRVNFVTFAQFHCKNPDDPDRKRKPYKRPPTPTAPLMPPSSGPDAPTADDDADDRRH